MDDLEKIGEGEAVERPMDFEQSTSMEEVNLEGLRLETDVISSEHNMSSPNGGKKRKPDETLDEQDSKSSNENNESDETQKKRKRENLKSSQETLSLKQATDELDLMCRIWVMELRRLPLDQQLFARKAVCDVLFEARLGQLNKDSVRINRSDVVQNYLTCVHEERGQICACPNGWGQSQQRAPSSQPLYPGHSQCYSKSGWKDNLSSPHRPPFFATYSNRFAAPSNLHYPRGPRIGRPIVITTALNNITTTTIVVVSPRLISTTAPSASANNQALTTATPGPSRINSVNILPYRVESSTSTHTSTSTNTPTSSHGDTPLNATTSNSSRYCTCDLTTDVNTSSSISSNTPSNPASSNMRNPQSTKPTVNSSTTPTVYTLCDVRMDTVTTDN